MRHLPFALAAFLTVSLLSGCGSDSNPAPVADGDPRPNILLIMVDDLGLNDLSLFGSEIETPNIDALARNGVILADFNAGPNCSPTRAMLMTGVDSHVVGLGWMAEVLPDFLKDRPGYEGYLNQRAATLPELMADAGYNTYMTGKWHLGNTEETSPFARGFDRTFSLANGGAGAFQNQLWLLPHDPIVYRENGKQVEVLPDDFYSTHFYTEKMIEFIDSDLGDGKPFLAFLSYTSPHWPLQAPAESIAKYEDTYLDGYDALKSRRLQRLKDLGFHEQDIDAFPRMLKGRPWIELTDEEQRYESKKMAIYAAMVDDLDVYIGVIVDHLKRIGEYENTLIFFMSDNGPEGNNILMGPGMNEYLEACCDNSYENIGNPDSYVIYGPDWAQAGNVPLRTYKSHTSQGGLLVPAFAHFPKNYPGGRTSDEFLTVKDVVPTILEVAKVEHPGSRMYRGREVVELEGRSMHPLLLGRQDYIRAPADYMGWEIFGRRAIRKGDWKAIYVAQPLFGENDVPWVKLNTWQLYNLAEDPGEVNDLSAQHTGKLNELVALWDEYAARNEIFIREGAE